MRQAYVAVFVHLVWATWDRLPLLTEEVTPAVYRAIGAKCEELRTQVVAIGGVEDHVHLLVKLPATVAIADLVKEVKGATSHLINYVLPNGGSLRWQGAYGAISVDATDSQQLIAYIANQRDHHLSGTALPDWEPEHENRSGHAQHTNGSLLRIERT